MGGGAIVHMPKCVQGSEIHVDPTCSKCLPLFFLSNLGFMSDMSQAGDIFASGDISGKLEC